MCTCNLTDQAIVECAHGILRHVLSKQKGGMPGENLHSQLEKVLHAVDHLAVCAKCK